MKMFIGLVSVVIVLNNFVCDCKSEEVNDVINRIELMMEPYRNMTGLPINYVFTEEQIQNNIQEYNRGKENEDITLNGTQIIQKYGYDVEEHHVTTSDGYVLTMYRIPCKGTCKGVVFLMHGFVLSFKEWITAGPDRALAFRLADSGYDVWMGNARGNTFSKKHISLSPSDDEFWDFSWDEIGRYDLPAMIDYVLDNTGEKDLIYIGHSQGTTAFFVLCSELPQYNNKIRLMIALSAAAWMKNVISPLLRIVAPFNDIITALGTAFGLNDVIPNNDFQEPLIRIFCGNAFPARAVCENLFFILCNFNYPQIDYEQLPVYSSHLGAGSSLKQFQHYAQLIQSGFFRQYDYGTEMNLKKYKTDTPPSYPVDKISCPTAIFYSYGDWLGNPIDVEVLRNKLQNVVDYYEVPLKTFNHVDFLFAKDVTTLINDRVVKLISDHTSVTPK